MAAAESENSAGWKKLPANGMAAAKTALMLPMFMMLSFCGIDFAEKPFQLKIHILPGTNCVLHCLRGFAIISVAHIKNWHLYK